jgi:hypothetical protein
VKVAASIRIETRHLSIENRGLTAHGAGEFKFEVGPVLKRVTPSRNRLAVMPLNVREGAKSIELQLKQPVGVVEGRRDADEGHGRDGHISASQIKGESASCSAVTFRNALDKNVSATVNAGVVRATGIPWTT